MKKLRKWFLRLVLLGGVAAAAWSGYRFFQKMPQRQQQIAVTKVRKGDVVVRSYARGELRAVRSATLIAPNLFGTVQVTRLAALGSFAREKDLIVEFDDAEVESRIEEKQLEIDQIDEQTKKAEAELAIRNNQDQVDLLRARYSVRRAELEVKRNELISEIDAKKNLLSLEEARRRLKQLESDVKSRQEQAKAELAVLKERKNRALLEMARERQRLSQVKLLAPMSGLVAIRQNMGTGFRMFGMQLPDIREGDQVQPGMPVADVLDLSELEISAKVGELDRANLSEGQDVIIRLDAVPDKTFHGKIKNMSGTASANIFSSDPAKKFDVTFSIDMKELLTGLGAKPDQIARVLATAEQNRKRAPVQSSSFASMAMLGGPGGGGFPGGGPGGGTAGPGFGGGAAGGGMPGAGFGGGMPGGGTLFVRPGEGGERAGPGVEGGAGRRTFGARGGEGGGPQLSDEQRQKMREAMQKALGGRNLQDLSPEERQQIFAKARESAGISAGGPGGERKRGPSAEEGGKKGAEEGARRRPRDTERAQAGPGAAPEGERRRVGGERRRGEGGEAAAGPENLAAMFAMTNRSQFSEKDLANAKLPPPPEEDTQLDVLLRPGLLADVEIIVEKYPDALHIPAQALFEKDGKLIVYVKRGERFEPQPVKIARRSESTVVLTSGVNAGDVIAMADPTVRPGAKGGGQKKSSGKSAMQGMGAAAEGGRKGN